MENRYNRPNPKRATEKKPQARRTNKPSPNRNPRNLPQGKKYTAMISVLDTVGELKTLWNYKQDKVRTVESKEKKPFPLGAVVIVTICTVLLMVTVLSYVHINEYTVEVADLKAELTSLEKDKKELTLELEKKNDMLEIERYAQENLGMVKSDQLTKKHITLQSEDKIEVVGEEPEKTTEQESGIMSAIVNNVRGLLEYLG